MVLAEIEKVNLTPQTDEDFVEAKETIKAFSAAESGHINPEQYYQDAWCVDQGGISEFRLPDGTRCDCLTKNHAVEVDFAPKFYEAVGQALYYSLQTNRRAGILLIMEKPSDFKYWLRLNSVIEHFKLPIDTWRSDQ